MEDLTPKQIEAIAMLAAGYSDVEAAKKCNVCAKTIARWKSKQDFQKILRESSTKMLDMALAELCLGAIGAARELRGIISDSDTPAKTKILAIQTLFSMALKVKEDALVRRLDAIEGILDGEADNSQN